MDEQLLQMLFDQVLAGETGDSSSQLNVAQDFAGSMFDPALGLMSSMMGGSGFNWDELFEYEDPEPEPQMPLVSRRLYESAINSDDEIEQMVADMVENGVAEERVKRMVREALGFDPSSDESKALSDTVRLYDSFVDRMGAEQAEFESAVGEYERQMASYDPTPKLKETDIVQKFRKAGIPLPTERPAYTASDFSPGASERFAGRDAAGSDSLAIQQSITDRLRKSSPAQTDLGPMPGYGAGASTPKPMTPTPQASTFEAGPGADPYASPFAGALGSTAASASPTPGGARLSELAAVATPGLEYVEQLIGRVGSGAPGFTPPTAKKGRHSNLSDWLSGDDLSFVQGARKQQSATTKKRQEGAGKGPDYWRQMEADIKAKGRAQGRTDQGRTPTTDALLERLLRAAGT